MGGLLHTRRFAARGFGLRTSRYSIPAVPLVAVLALVFTTVPFTPAAVAAPEPACTTAEKTVVAAAAMAKRCGTKVEISALRSETDQTFARPTGGYTTEQSVEPRWAKKPDGTWTAIDTRLQADANGVVAPMASALPVVFSGGGTGPVAVLREGDHELALTWPGGSLPKPTLSGPNATYAEVFPGVDLRFTATPQGFSQLLVVKTKEAATHPDLAEVKFGLTTKGVEASPNGTGGLVAKDPAGKVVFDSPVPVMWDSTPDRSATPSKVAPQSKTAADSPATLRRVTMPVKVGGGELAVTPSAAMMADPTTKFPVFIDPSWTGHIQDNAWTMVMGRSDLTNTSFWQNGAVLSNWDVAGGAGVGRVCDVSDTNGNCHSPEYLVRSFFRMDLEEMAGKVVSHASFRLQQQWSWTCSAGNTSARVWIANGIDSGTTWNNQPMFWEGDWTTAPANHRVDSQFGCQGTGDVEFDVSAIVKKAVDGDWPAVTLGMRAIDENTVNQWKRYNPTTPVLAIDYNTPPNVPDELTVDGKACATGAARPFTPTATPTLRARFSDDDPADTMNGSFEWSRVREDGTFAPVAGTREVSGLANGAISETTLPLPTGLPFGVLDGSDAIIGAADWDGDGRSDVLAEDSDGYQYLFPGDATKLGARVLLGAGWSPYTIAGVADWDKDGKADVIARYDPTGQLYVYPGENKRGPSSQARALIGTGFGAYSFAGVADWDKDGKTDLIAEENSTGTLYLFPGENKRSPSSQTKVPLGTGWGNRNVYGVIDRTGDGAPDVIAQVNNDGKLWLYPGTGARTPFPATPVRHQIGAGWADATVFTTPDFNGGGATDLVAQLPGTSTWQLYPGVVGTGSGGTPWPIAGLGVAEGTYRFHATAGDGQLTSAPSDWCEFTVDLTDPSAPSATSVVYKPSGCPALGCGSLGVADTFTFSGSPDVVKYQWGFTDPPSMTVMAPSMGAPASVGWTPPSSGAKTLYVRAVDRAGRGTSTAFQFVVAGPTVAIGQWLFGDDPSMDQSGGGHNLDLVGVVSGRPGRTIGGDFSVGFDGTSASSATAAKVIDTSRGFSVSGWVRLTDDAVDRTVVSQQGGTSAAFRLGYVATSHKWVFSLADTDVQNPAQWSALSDTQAATGVWTHLSGTYDSATRDVRLYVDGALQRESAAVVNGFGANGQLWIGRGLVNGTAGQRWKGDLADVRVWDRAITPQEIAAAVDPNLVSRIGKWRFNEASGNVARDSTQFAHDLTLTLAAGASWGTGRDGTSGLHLNGTGSAESGEPVLNTDQSFSVDVWAKLADQGTRRTVAVQRGSAGVDTFALVYDGAKWSAEMPTTAASPTNWWRAKSTANATVNTWTHLVAVYDASAKTLKLSVGDVPQSTVTGVAGWSSAGQLSVGRSTAGAFWNGDIDDLKVYQGVLAAKPLTTVAPTGSSVSGDARAEIISVDADGTVRAYLNVNGAYAGPQSIGSGWKTERTWFADVDGDGKNEIISLETDGTVKAFPNLNGMNGSPFGAAVSLGTAPNDPSRLRFADVDGDGRADRVSLDADGRVRVYRNLFGLTAAGQPGTFSTTPVIVTVTGQTPNKIRFADLDGDHKADFITINNDGTVFGYRNLSGLGYGTFDSYQEIGSEWTPDRTWFADINGDGKAEIITVRQDGTVLSFPNVNGLNGSPYGEGSQIGSGWLEPARVFFG